VSYTKIVFYLGIVAAVGGVFGLASVIAPPPSPAWRSLGAIQPRLSPDGASIAFAYQGAIWRIPREGGVMRRLTTQARWDSDPSWSPDGMQIAYLSSGAVVLINAQTGAPAPFPERVRAGGSIRFHPDGKRILGNFSTGTSLALAWLDPASGNVKPILEPPAAVNRFALSDDGKAIAYATHRDVAGEQTGNDGPQADVWIVSADGGVPKKLVRFPSRIYDLAWNGPSLIVVSEVGGAHNDLWEISVQTDPTRARKLTFGQADEDAPSAAGGWLLYTDNREGSTALVTRNLATGDERLVTVTGLDYGKPTGTLSLELFEMGTGGPLSARIALQEEGGKPAAPPGSLYRLHGDQMDFFAERTAEVVVPAGSYHIHAYHGPEYRMAHLQVEVPAAKTTSVKVELQRWTDPQSRGWYSGENHIHANYGYGHWYNTPREMRVLIEAEALNVANFVVANSDTDGVFDREFFRGRPDPYSGERNILYWNEEFRATFWGHMTLINLKQLVEPVFTGFLDTTNPWDAPTNSDVADHTHVQGGHVNYTHPASNPKDPYLGAYSAKSVPMDVALGKIDSIDINWSYEPTLSLWYRLLNCGFRLPASAGTDCFLNRIASRLPGSDRAYVKIEGNFSYDGWVKGLKAGRSFVTNGPILEFTPGEIRRLAAPGEIPVKASATSLVPLDRVEVVMNGAVVAQGAIAADKLSATIDERIKVERSSWIGVRAFAGRLQAHSSPIYVEVAGQRQHSQADAEFFLAWIDRLEAQLNKRDRVPSAELKKHVEGQLNAAREVYRKLAR
jgi:Tol biopolymer transport system component